MMSHQKKFLAALSAAIIVLGVMSGSPAAAVVSSGPLVAYDISTDLNCSVTYAGDTSPAFFGNTACATLVNITGSGLSTLYGPAAIPAGGGASPRTAFTPVSQVSTGLGTSASPFIINTVVDAGSNARVTQLDSYVVGDNAYSTTTTVAPLVAGLTITTYYGADCYLGDNDTGFGEYDSATGTVTCRGQETVGGVAVPSGRVEQFVPLTSGSRHFYGNYSSTWSAIATGLPLDNSLNAPTDIIDNGMALSWTGAPGATLTTSRLTNFSTVNVRPIVTSLTLPATAVGGSSVIESATVFNPNSAAQTVTSLSFALPTGATYVAGSVLPSTLGVPTEMGGVLTFTSPIIVPANSSLSPSFQITLGVAAGTFASTLAGSAQPAPVIGSSAAIEVTAPPVNTAPVAAGQSVTTPQDVAKAITLSGSDADGNVLTYTTSATSHGTVSGSGASVVYTPAPGYSGPDSFTFTVNDGMLSSAPATVSITVTPAAPVNTAPVANNLSVTTAQDTAKAITLTASDANGDALAYTATAPSHGVLSGSGANRTYTPTPGYFGPDSFTFTVNDGIVSSPPATVSIIVTPAPPVNTAPVANSQSVTTPQDTAKAITLSGSDADGNMLTYNTNTPSHGTLSGSGANLTYTPSAGYSGADSFTFTVNDGTVSSASATVSITVTAAPPLNTAPVAASQTVITAQDTAKAIVLAGSDANGDPVTFTTGAPSHGSLSGTGANRIYTPAAGYSGADSFTFTVNDGTVSSAPATVSITVTPAPPVNRAPVADSQSVVTAEDNAKAITLTGSDADGNALVYTTGTPSHGSLSGTGANRIYSPAAGYSGADSFTFTVNDGTVSSAPATVSITVTPTTACPPNAAPVASGQSVTTSRNHPVTITLVGTDADGNHLSYQVVQPSHGMLTGWENQIVYTPARGYVGADSFTFTVSDGRVVSPPATVSITVQGVNTRPRALPGRTTVRSNHSVSVILLGRDRESDELTYTVGTARHGTVTGTGNHVVYTPTPGYVGHDSFTFTVSDGMSTSAAARIHVTVLGPRRSHR